MLYVFRRFPLRDLVYGSGLWKCLNEQQGTNFVIERLVARDCYLVGGDAGKILLIPNVLSYLYEIERLTILHRSVPWSSHKSQDSQQPG
jgi:hypothetical protein